MGEKTDCPAEGPALVPQPDDMDGSEDQLLRCRWMCHKVPLTYRQELYHIVRMTGPLLLSRILNYLLPFVVTMFCGRLGNEVMAGYGLACATINVTTAATGYGLGLACDTLVSQTFGGKNLLRVGVILQRGVIILLLFCLPCWGLLMNAQAILLCVRQDPEVARIAQLYITAFLPAVPAMFLHHLQVSYLQNQDIILPQMYTAAVANVANVVTNYFLLHWLNLGVSGSAAANALSHVYNCTFLFAYIWWKKLHIATWGGMLGEDELAAQHAVIMVAFLTYMFPLGVQAATCARVGNALGAGDSDRAFLTCKVSFALAGSFAVVEGLVLGSTRTVIGFIFTPDEKIVGLVSHLMNAYCFLQFFDGLVCVCTGIFLGTGKQKIPAVANFVGYYCIGLSLSVTLMFVAKLGVLGFWLGLLVCVILQSTFYITIIFQLNWGRMTEEAVKRARTNTHVTLSTADVSDMEGSNSTGQSANQSEDGYMSVSTQDRNGNMETQDGNAQPKDRGLSTAQLLLRRGLAVFVAAALLAVGASVHFLVPLPEPHYSEANVTLKWINATNATAHHIFSTALAPNEE
ncbi:multidrug and toxin extrusion protein 1-like isoform X2 [Betta splendens]|uniref:Multidrug and toxin extrusion protein n=1 Tax=Betta splendens TaxID=158456 RepID=A0A9W2Y7V7_BETSP|nr:multidrug and toxin extrusion protein 1-like isoform X2 [Betta splendens]